MAGKKKLFYRKCKNRIHTENHPHYELLEYLCDIPHVIDGFQRLLDLKKFVKSHYENYDLKKAEKDRHNNAHPPAAGMDHVYLPLSGKTVRGLSWGMDWHKVARQRVGIHRLFLSKSIFFKGGAGRHHG